MRKMKTTKVGLAAVGAAALMLGAVSTASADVQPQAHDAVAVGSDTAQYGVNFLDDGAGALPGYNTLNGNRRVFSFDATGDANGRSTYKISSTTVLDAKIVLRAGSGPITRPNGSTAGINAILADSTHQIDFVRSSRLPTPGEQTSAAGTAGFGAGIHVFQIADDQLQIAVNNAGAAPLTNAPATFACDTLWHMYNGDYATWGAVPGYSGPAPLVAPVYLVPQASSGTFKDFDADLKACHGTSTSPSYAGAIPMEEHDYLAVTGNKNAIAPFSVGRYNLIQSNYFGAGVNAIALETGVGAYNLARHIYILCRDTDVTSATPFQLGGSLNLVKTLFGTSTSFFAKASTGGPLIAAAGLTQNWQDLLLAHS